MKHKLRVLLTGDDGYRAIGIRIVANALKNDFDCFIAATSGQQSGVGGHISLNKGGSWGEDTVDGVPAFWVDGYPCDAVECMVGYHKKPFDLIVSGINLGMNIGGSLVSSGTYSAAARAMGTKLAPKAIVLSWMLPPSFWHQKHNGAEPLTPYLEYPGRVTGALIRTALKEDLWGADILNVNFPEHASSKAVFTRGLDDVTKFFNYPLKIDRLTHRFSYPDTEDVKTVTKDDISTDTGAILSGYISVTPHAKTPIHESISAEMHGKELTL